MKISVNFDLEVDIRAYGLTKEEMEEEVRESLEREFEGDTKDIKIKFEE